MQENKVTTRDYIEQFIGCTLLLGCSVGLFKQAKMFKSLFKNYDYLLYSMPEKVNFNKFIQNPGLKEYVVLPHFNCMASDELFKNHMKMVWDYKAQAHQDHLYPQPCSDFEGDVVENNKHLKFYCNCKTMKPYVSSSLLCNVQAIHKQHIKTRVTMIMYGEMEYCKDKHMFIAYPEIMGTTKQELYNAWDSLLGVVCPLFLSLLGAAFGVGLCMSYYQADNLMATGNKIKGETDKLIETNDIFAKMPDLLKKKE